MAEFTTNNLIYAVLLVFLLFVVGGCWATGFCQETISRFKILIPGFNFSSGDIEKIQIIGYNIGTDKPKYYDGTSWQEFPEKMKFGKKEISKGSARYYFAEYYFDKNLRNKSLKTFELPDANIRAVITGIISSEEKNRGNVLIFLDQKDVSREYLGKVFRIGEMTKYNFEDGDYIDVDRQIFLRYNGKEWEWTVSEYGWLTEEWKIVSLNPQARSERFNEIIKNLVGKNLEAGKEILLQRIESSPYEKFIFTAPDSKSKEFGGPKLIQEIYFRYANNGWEWSTNNQEWIDIKDSRIVSWDEQTSEPFVESIDRLLIISLRNKNLEAGKEAILNGKTYNYEKPIKLLKGLFTLTLHDEISFEEQDETGQFVKTSEEEIIKKYGFYLAIKSIVKQKAIAWRDSVFEKPMRIKFDTGEECSYKVEKYSISEKYGSAILKVDLTNSLSQDEKCKS